MKTSAIAIALTLSVIAGLFVLRNQIVPEHAHHVLSRKAEGERQVYTGSWHFPRGGPYVLGFESESDVVLQIAGRTVANGSGEQKRRIVYQAGNYPLRIEAQGPFRLLWHPPGRRPNRCRG